MTKQYYLIQFRSPDVYKEDMHVVVNSVKELKDFVRQDVESLMNEEIIDDNVRISKRMHTGHMYREPNAKIVGKVFSYKRLRPTGYYKSLSDDEIGDGLTDDENYLCYWCVRIPKDKLVDFTKFEEI